MKNHTIFFIIAATVSFFAGCVFGYIQTNRQYDRVSVALQKERSRIYNQIKENYTENKGTKKDVYYVIDEFVLTTKNIKELNTIISIADDNGININGSINFDLSDKDRIESEMYKDAYNQTKQKAESILRSSKMKLGTPIIVSEDVEFQQKMIDRIDQDWEVTYDAMAAPSPSMEAYSTNSMDARKLKAAGRAAVDYTPKPLKLTQNISVMYEMK